MNAEPRGADLRNGAMVGSRPVDLSAVGHGVLKNVTAEEVKDAEHVSYANFPNNGRDMLVRKERGRYLFRLIYPRCAWVSAGDLPQLYQPIALAWLRLRRRGTL